MTNETKVEIMKQPWDDMFENGDADYGTCITKYEKMEYKLARAVNLTTGVEERWEEVKDDSNI